MQMTSHEPLYSPSPAKNLILPQNLREQSTTSKTPVNDNQHKATTAKILEAFLRQSTHCKYNNYMKHWLAYSKTMGKIEVTRVLDLISDMFDKGHVYSTTNSAKCAIATNVSYTTFQFLE